MNDPPGQGVPTFTIPPERVGTVLSALSPPRRLEWWDGSRRFLSQEPVGQLTLRTKAGETIAIRFFPNQHSLCFAVDGVACIRAGKVAQNASELRILSSLLGELRSEAQTGQTDTDELERLLGELSYVRSGGLAKGAVPDCVAIPAPEEVDRLTAKLYEALDFGGQPAVPEFVVPHKYVADILGALVPAKTHDYWHGFPFDTPLARLKITTRRGKTMVVRIDLAGSNPLHFCVDGVRCVRGGKYIANAGESQLLAGVLWLIHQQLTNGETGRFKLEDVIAALRHSRGDVK
jgi:hypothetical protein